MKKIIATLLVTTFAVGSAYAQSATTPSANPAPTTAPSSSTSNPSPGGSAAVTGDSTSGALVTTVSHLSAGQTTSSKIVGASVYNTNNDKIGAVNDLIVDPNGKIENVIIGVGGFLGIGERNVAVSYASIKFSKDNKGYEHLTLAATKDQLKAMTPYDTANTGG